MADNFRDRYGPYAVVTGASSGIGEGFARALAARGLDLVVAARRGDRLDTLAAELSARHGVAVRCVAADLATPDGLDALLSAIEGVDVGLLVSNAGVARFGEYLDLGTEEQDRLLALHITATHRLTYAIGRRLRDRGRGGVILVSSTAGFFAAPYSALTAATKGWQRQFGEALAVEWKTHGVDVQILCPALTDTEGVRAMDLAALKKKPVPVSVPVESSLRALGRRGLVIPGWRNRLANAILSRAWPRALVPRLIGRIFRKLRPASGG